MLAEVESLIENAKIIIQEIEESFGVLTAEQLNWKPGENSWSVAQCFEHLVVTNNLYFANIQKVADGTHRNNFFSKIPLVPDFIGFTMKKVLAPEWRIKMKTLKMFKPSFSDISESIIGKFNRNQNKLISLMEATKNLDVRKIKVAEPIGRAVNLRLIDAFEILVVHEKRHFNQAKRVMKSKGFPIQKEAKR